MSERKLLLKKLKNNELQPIDLSLHQLHTLTKERVYDNYGSLIIKTQHKTFDQTTDDICIGYADSNTCLSDYVRPFNLMEDCGVKTSERGFFLREDLEKFKQFDGYDELYHTIRSLNPMMTYIVYAAFHRYGTKIVTHGFVITDEHYQFVQHVQVGVTFKSKLILDEIRKYVSFELQNA